MNGKPWLSSKRGTQGANFNRRSSVISRLSFFDVDAAGSISGNRRAKLNKRRKKNSNAERRMP